MSYPLDTIACSLADCGESVAHQCSDTEDLASKAKETIEIKVRLTGFLNTVFKELTTKGQYYQKYLSRNCFLNPQCTHFVHGRCLYRHVLFELRDHSQELLQFQNIKCPEPGCQVRFSSASQFKLFRHAKCNIGQVKVDRYDRPGKLKRESSDPNYEPTFTGEIYGNREKRERKAKNGRGNGKNVSSSSSSYGTPRKQERGKVKHHSRRKQSAEPEQCMKRLRMNEEGAVSEIEFNGTSDTLLRRTSCPADPEPGLKFNQQGSSANQDRESSNNSMDDSTELTTPLKTAHTVQPSYVNKVEGKKDSESSDNSMDDLTTPLESIHAIEQLHLNQNEGQTHKVGESTAHYDKKYWFGEFVDPFNIIPPVLNCLESVPLNFEQWGGGQTSESQQPACNAAPIGSDIVDMAIQRAFGGDVPEASTSSAALSQETRNGFEEIPVLEGGTIKVSYEHWKDAQSGKSSNIEKKFNKMEQVEKEEEEEGDEFLRVEVMEFDDDVQYCGTKKIKKEPQAETKRVPRPAEVIDLLDSDDDQTSGSFTGGDSTSNTSGTRNNSEADADMSTVVSTEADSSTNDKTIVPLEHNMVEMERPLKMEFKVEGPVQTEGRVQGLMRVEANIQGSNQPEVGVQGSMQMTEYTDKKKGYKNYCGQVKIGVSSNMGTAPGSCDNGGDASRPSGVQCVNSRAGEVNESENNVAGEDGNLACGTNGEEMEGQIKTSRMEED